MRISIRVLALALVAALPVSAEEPAPAEAPSITPAELQARREAGNAPLIVDVRSPDEYAAGHIPGAVNIPHDQVPRLVSEARGENGVALYCMVGPRARKGEAALLAAGTPSVFHLEGGLAAWQQAGLPVDAR